MPAILPQAMKDKRARAELLYAEVEAVLTNESASVEERNQIEAKLREADELSDDLFNLADIRAAQTKLASFAESEKATAGPGSSDFPTTGEFLVAVYNAGRNKKHDPRLKWFADEALISGQEAKDLVENVGPSGGFLVPVEGSTDILSVAAEQSVFIQYGTRIPMRRRQIGIPALDQTGSTPTGRPHWFGGIQVYWAAEEAEKTGSDPKWREVTLTANEIIGFTRASNALLADAAISLEAFFNGPLGFGGAISWMTDWACIRGTGVGQPRGFLGAPGTIVVPRATAGTITYPDLLNMLQVFLATGGRGMWLVSQSALATLAQMNGPAGNPSYVWMTDAASGLPGRLLGMPVQFTEKMPALGVEGDIALINPPFYLVGDRQAITIESTEFENWKFNKHSWRAVARIDGQPWMSAPLTLQDGTSQLSPFVVLGTPST